jgi:hypothetical protein
VPPVAGDVRSVGCVGGVEGEPVVPVLGVVCVAGDVGCWVVDCANAPAASASAAAAAID